MPFNGSGGFNPLPPPIYPAVNGTTIEAAQYNDSLSDVFTGLGNCITRDGQSPATANLPMGTNKLTGLGAATASGQALVFGQSAAELASLTVSGNTSVGGNLAVTGNTTVTGTLTVGGTPIVLGNYLPLAGGTVIGQTVFNNAAASPPIVLNGLAGNAFMAFQRAGAAVGDIGSSDSVISGGAAADFGISSRPGGNLVLGGNTRAALYIAPAGNTSIVAPSSGTTLALTNIAGSNALTTTDGTVISYLKSIATTSLDFGTSSAHALNLATAGTVRLKLTAAGLITDAADLELGYKGLPSASVTTGAFIAGDRGKCVYATGGVTVPNAVMAAGDVVVIQNTTAGAITITATVATLRWTLAGGTGNRTLSAYGRCSLIFLSSTSATISGDLS